MSCSNSHYLNATFLFLIDTHWHCCAFFLSFLLSFFHSFFLPVAWPIDLAVQGCKYHCGLFHSCPSTFTSIHTPILTCITFLHFELLGPFLHGKSHAILPSHYSSLHLTVCFKFTYAYSIFFSYGHQEIPLSGCHSTVHTLTVVIKMTGICRIWQGITLFW